jgi:hypothetical protein
MKLSQKKNDPVCIEDILNVFHDIEISITEMHKNSSEVFLQLNDFLKEYYKKNSIVSANATQIFDTIVGNKESNLNDELNVIFNELEKYKTGTENELDANLNIYNQLNNKIDYISLVIRNFKQDLTTLKFLITNHKLISTNENTDSISFDNIQRWEKTLVHIHPWLTAVGKLITNLSIYLGALYTNTKIYSQNSVNKNFSFYEELKSAIALVNKKNIESKNFIPILKEKINSSAESISNIITHLQYHDIIRQKVEHIQQSHAKIIISLKEDAGNYDKTLLTEDDEKFSLISDIAGLQAAQLILITKEYQKALEVISNNFQKMADDLTKVSTISHEFSFEANNSENTLIKVVKERLDKSLLLLDEYNSSSFNQELVTVKEQILDIYKTASGHVLIPLEELGSPRNIFGNISPDYQNETENKPSVVFQITSLANDIIEKKDDLQEELELVFKLSERFLVETDSNGFRSNLEKEQIRIMVQISRTLDRLDEESKQLDSVLLQNLTIKKDIINKLKETINHADYYELFEKVLNEIIEQLNILNNRLRHEGNITDRLEKGTNLKEIEALYTVASERIIHQKIIDGDNRIELTDNQASDDDMELF